MGICTFYYIDNIQIWNLEKEFKDHVYNEESKEEEIRKYAHDYSEEIIRSWSKYNGFPFLLPDSVMETAEGRFMVDKMNMRKDANIRKVHAMHKGKIPPNISSNGKFWKSS